MTQLRFIQRLRCRKALTTLRLVVLDVDGVLTDRGLWYGESGEVFKRFDVRDGLGIRLLQESGIEVAFLSGGRSGALEVRAQHLGIRYCLFGIRDKSQGMINLLSELNVLKGEVAFVGDDLNDLTVRSNVGLLVATADAAAPLRRKADLVLRNTGGRGAVRELTEMILKSRGLWRPLARLGWFERND